MEQMMREKKAPPSQPKKKISWKNFLKELPGKVAKFFRGVVHELKRVTWPTRNEVWKYTIIVLVTIAIFAIILGIFDFIWLKLTEVMILD